MALKGTFTPKASLTEAPTNLKEAIDWVLRVTGRDGKGLGDGECICGLAAAVTDLLQSVELEYNGYEGDTKDADPKKGASQQDVEKHLNGLFSLVQGLGGTAVVRTYIDQLAQVLSALVGWSKIEKCEFTKCETNNGGRGGGKCIRGRSSGHGATKCCCDNNGKVDHQGSLGCCKVGGQKDGKCANGCCSHGGKGCKYLADVTPNTKSCDKCECKIFNDKGHHLGRGCQRCKDSGSRNSCQCSESGDSCSTDNCKCALAGKCCKCCCTSCSGCKKECSCVKEEGVVGRDECNRDSYMSAYPNSAFNKRKSFLESERINDPPSWKNLWYSPPGTTATNSGTITERRHHCARILLGSVCLIWSGITYMYWTGRQAHNKNSPRWSNYILDGSGLDDGSLSQWLQALGFPKAMLNNHGPGNRLDQVINNDFLQKFYLGFPDTSQWNGVHGMDRDGNTFRDPHSFNVGGFIHAINKGAFGGSVFQGNGTHNGIDQHELGPLFKLYILSCAYFTGLQKHAPLKAENKTPRTIREVLYWLSALPYSQAYPKIMDHCKKKLDGIFKKSSQQKLSFTFKPGAPPFTVEKDNVYAHFQAVTQCCPLVLIGIQGGIHSTTKGTDKTTEPAIHALYANTECHFTYPTVDIQAYNQVVHYIRGLFYQLYFLRKQCAVKVTCGGKWRECRYGKDVVSKGVISWMCLGCSPMEHDRKRRVTEMEKILGGVKSEAAGTVSRAIKDLLVPLGRVVVQLGNAHEALERGEKEGIYQSMVIGLVGALGEVVEAVKNVVDVLEKDTTLAKEKKESLKKALEKVLDVVLEVVTKLEEGVKKKDGNGNGKKEAQEALGKANAALKGAKKDLGNDNGKLKEAQKKLEELTNGGNGSLQKMWEAIKDEKEKSLKDFIDVSESQHQVDPGKNTVSAFIHRVLEVLNILKQIAENDVKGNGNSQYYYQTRIHVIIPAIENMFDIVGSTRCVHCQDHSNKCGRRGEQKTCDKCHQQYMDGFPSPLQAFLEDRLPGFSCHSTMEALEKDANGYPPAASHLHHTNSPGQCCPLPMGFRGQFYSGITDCTGQRLYGILYFFSDENMMESCVYRLVRVTSALSATTPQVLGDVFGFFRGGVGNPQKGKPPKKEEEQQCDHNGNPSETSEENKTKYFCGWCASGLRDEVKQIEWIEKGTQKGGHYMDKVGKALINIKGEKDSAQQSVPQSTTSNLSTLTDGNHYVSPLTGELYTAVSATFGGTYLSWVLYLSDALEGGLQSLSEAFLQIECRGCKGQCDPNKCKKGEHGRSTGDTKSTPLCQCQSIVSCTGVLPVLYRHGFSYGNPFNLEGYQQGDGEKDGDYSITDTKKAKHCHEFLDSLSAVIKTESTTPLSNLLSQVGKLQYDIRLPWIFVLTVAWLVAVLYLAFGAIWPLDWTHMRSHWLRGGEHQWQCMWYKVMTGRKGVDLMEYFGKT